ncbi:hypothetical protein [Halomonas sp. SCS19]|uniref:hypothetical protein n=1 Tax=Halomonas sp. SCS19 TaxID=2950870 RepID=UPI0032DEE53E|tara:strand:+ start:1083 stop:1352 length:270 start_codon:yes stop_codon:yes gene_type:complete
MAVYDIIYWGWDDGEKHRGRDAIKVQLTSPLVVDQEVQPGLIPELDRKLLNRPVVVFDESPAENAGSEKAFHVIESKPKQRYPGIPSRS